MKVMNVKEAYEYLKENTFLMTDTTMLDFEALAFAVKNNMLFAVDGEHFVAPYYTWNNTRWIVDRVYKVSPEEKAEYQLICDYRYTAHCVHAPAGYEGIKEIDAGLVI